ncbi:MAG: DNA topoisomerase 4 subunit A [Myxococcales bacterium]|nr:DNA topoisomerase 4 subunit A [Myxococcales bacterium]
MTESAHRIVDANLESELGFAFGRYAKTTILSRAIPDVRDGLKPVQRRILYAMHLARNTSQNPYRKCAKTVGEVMGTFHPHGDSSIYEALVRLAQDWKMRAPLIDGQGNFGSMDDDPPAAMRYTEARLSPIADVLLAGLDQDTVDFQPNFDDKDEEPIVLPARFPNLLVNGTSGVSTGFATEIPPHNLGECIDALVAMIDRPELTLAEAMNHVKGPDFPTGGLLMGADTLVEAYRTGRGRCTLRARTVVETLRDGRQQIVVTEIPYGVIKADLVKEIERLKTEKIVQGISDVRDETDREGLRMVVDLQRGVDADPVLAFLFKKTELQVYRHFLMVAISNRTPETLGLLQMLRAYLDHQREVVTRRSRFLLDRAETRLHLVDGLIKAVDILDEVIATIRASKDRPDAHKNLMARFGFSDPQTTEILDLRLHRLTNLQILDLRKEKGELEALIAKLQKILGSEAVLLATIRAELLETRKLYADARRTEIVDRVEEVTDTKLQVTVTVKAQDVVVALSQGGYIKRVLPASAEKIGGDGGLKEGDSLRFRLDTNTLHRVAWFTAHGKAYSMPVHQLPEAKWSDAGSALVNVVQFEKDDRVVQVFGQSTGTREVPLEQSIAEFESEVEALFVTKLGAVKRTPLKELTAQRSTGVTSIKLADDDELLTVLIARPGTDLLLVTREGNGIRFTIEEIPVQGRSAGGVRGMKLAGKDRIVSALLLDSEGQGEVAIITDQGRGKKSWYSDFPVQHRGGRGVIVIQRRERLPHRIAFAAEWPLIACEFEHLRLIRSDLTTVKLPTSKLRRAGRDGSAYEFDMVPDGIKVEFGQRLFMPIPEGAVAPDAPTPPPPPSTVIPLIIPDSRGGWTKGVLPGLGLPGDDEGGDDDAGA